VTGQSCAAQLRSWTDLAHTAQPPDHLIPCGDRVFTASFLRGQSSTITIARSSSSLAPLFARTLVLSKLLPLLLPTRRDGSPLHVA